ncbi:MAG: DUF115 domain-containing protein [Anaerolineales bacterium]|nr:DUF115 domain-containing protein [Anaerolineales bacterium]
MERIDPRELSLLRLTSAIWRRIADVPDAIAWWSDGGRANRGRLRGFENMHAGERCFVMGNGPSLAKMDLSLLREEVTFGLNRIYLLFEQINFVPSYYVCTNELVLRQFGEEIRALEMPKFLNWNSRNLFGQSDPTINFLRMRLSVVDRMQTDATRPLYGGGTVTFAALQLAFFMGFETVVLVGVDHRFFQSGIPNRTVRRTSERDEDHFHPGYFPAGSQWQLPDLRRSEIAYRLAERAYSDSGRRILDATINGACPVFEKKDYHDLFEGKIP